MHSTSQSLLATGIIPYLRRSDLVLGPPDEHGFRVIKNSATGEFFRLGPEEAFLLERLDATLTGPALCSAFARHFHRAFSLDELAAFLALAHSHGLLQPVSAPDVPRPGIADSDSAIDLGIDTPAPVRPPSEAHLPLPVAPSSAPAASASGPALLHLRFKLFDPDSFFTWLCPWIAFVWSPAFAVASLFLIAIAGVTAWSQHVELARHFHQALNGHTLVLVWLTLLAVTLLHEFAHGLTCKHYGGEVHEVGLLLIYLLPGMYCNVSDTWLFPQRRHRLLVTLAGCWSDLLVWSIAVLGWRLSAPQTWLHHLLWVVLSVVGARILINLNPLIRLDGYYLLNDLVGIPNLQQQATARLAAVVRWLVWGRERPAPHPRGAFLFAYGLANWIFGVALLGVLLAALMQLLGERLGAPGCLAVLLLAYILLRGLLAGLEPSAGEGTPATQRHRVLLWTGLAVAGLVYLSLGTLEHPAAGAFQLRSADRAEVRAPVAAFVTEVCVREGESVSAGAIIARLRVPNLDTRLEQARAEIREAEARLALLRAGARAEEREAHRRRERLALAAVERARQELILARAGYEAELQGMEAQLAAAQAEGAQADASLRRAQRLRASGALAQETYEETQRRSQVATSHTTSLHAQLRARQLIGIRDAERELWRRERELTEAQSALHLVEAGARSEEIEAEQARLTRAREEVRFLRHIETSLTVRAQRPGLITTAHLSDQVGRYLREGELICTIEQPDRLEAEVLLLDHECIGVETGQRVSLRPRDQPWFVVHGTVERLAPRAVRGGSDPANPTSGITAYCRVEEAPEGTRPGALGYARVQRERRPLRTIVYEKVMALLRVEYWW